MWHCQYETIHQNIFISCSGPQSSGLRMPMWCDCNANSGIMLQFVDSVLTVWCVTLPLRLPTSQHCSVYILQLITILIALQNNSCKPCSANICNVFCTVLHVFQQPVNSYIPVTLPTTSHLQVIVSTNHCL